MEFVVSPLLHKYEYGVVPPETETEALPSLLEVQDTLEELGVKLNALGCVIFILVEDAQPVASVTVTE